MKTEIREYLDSFKTSKAIFKVESTGKLSLIHQVPKPPHEDDVIKQIVYDIVEERFYPEYSKYRINYNDVENRIEITIQGRMLRFLALNMETVAPTQTKLFKWLRENRSSPPVYEGLYELYRYIAPMCDDMKFIGEDVRHRKNVVSILEAMMARYN